MSVKGFIVSKVKDFVFKTKLFLSNTHNRSEVYAGYLGCNIGNNCIITGKVHFGSEPFLINIGDNVRIAHGVMFQTHDGGVGIFRDKYPGINIIKGINVGNNVFIGIYVTIMPGVNIGNNVVIGASSIVTRDIPDNCVYVGAPAKFVSTLAEYEEKALAEGIYIKHAPFTNERKQEILSQLTKKYNNNKE